MATLLVQTDVAPELRDRLRPDLPALCASQRPKETLRVFGRSKQVSCFDKTPELIGSNESNVLAATPVDDHWLPPLSRLVQECFQIGARFRNCRFSRHFSPVREQGTCHSLDEQTRDRASSKASDQRSTASA